MVHLAEPDKAAAGLFRFTRLDVVRANNVPDVLSEHREILRVIREKDLDAIEPLIRQHLYGGLRRMGTQLYAEKYRSYFYRHLNQ